MSFRAHPAHRLLRHLRDGDHDPVADRDAPECRAYTPAYDHARDRVPCGTERHADDVRDREGRVEARQDGSGLLDAEVDAGYEAKHHVNGVRCELGVGEVEGSSTSMRFC